MEQITRMDGDGALYWPKYPMPVPIDWNTAFDDKPEKHIIEAWWVDFHKTRVAMEPVCFKAETLSLRLQVEGRSRAHWYASPVEAWQAVRIWWTVRCANDLDAIDRRLKSAALNQARLGAIPRPAGETGVDFIARVDQEALALAGV